ncbi:MAG TPA: phosphoglycerate kinase [Clostridia bacterium]|nr:phosphoglycerate kinase [Clostridia bacterium]
MQIKNILDIDVAGKKVLFRPDINSPIDANGKITNTNRLEAVAPTLKYLLDGGASVGIIAHQGDTLDYQNLISLEEHASILSKLVGTKVEYIDDVCGDRAIEKIKALKPGEAILLGNLRYLTEEVSTFEKDVKLHKNEMGGVYLVRRLKGLFDIYVNESFSAAHRNAPSLVAFPQIMPSYAGPLFFKEYEALSNIMKGAKKPVVFVLGGAKISDAFGMMENVLKNGIADKILACGVTGQIMLIAKGIELGKTYVDWLKGKDLLVFVEQAKKLLSSYGDQFVLPVDLAFEKDGVRKEVSVNDLPADDVMLTDIGSKTIEIFKNEIMRAGTVFSNGPAGVYEKEASANGTRGIWKAFSEAKGYTVIGGGDTVASASKFIDIGSIDYVCTAGGAMVRFLSGKVLPMIDAMTSK